MTCAASELQPYARVGVGGSVIRTTLARGLVASRSIIDYNDEGEELERLVSYTDHPIGQLMACHCDSGKTFRDCLPAAHYAEPGRTCGCESGKAFADWQGRVGWRPIASDGSRES